MQYTYAQVPATNLVAHYAFSNNTNDGSGNGNNGITTGCSYVNDRFGNPTSALYLNGVNDLLEMPVSGLGPITGDYTISFWLKSSQQIETQFMTYGSVASASSFSSLLNSSGVGMVFLWHSSGSAELLSKTSSIVDNQWHNVIISSENDVVNIWVDKVLRKTNTITDNIGDSFESFFIGLDNLLSTENELIKYKGAVDDIAFYDRALTVNEIDDIYHENRKLEITSPKETDAYVLNDACKITWKYSHTITDILAEYSIDNGLNWTFLTNINPQTDEEYIWSQTFPIGTNVLVKLSDANDLVVYDISNYTVSEYSWQLINASCEFSKRDGQDLISMNNKFYHLAGWSSDFVAPALTTNEIWSSVDGLSWDLEIEAPWNGRHISSFVKYQDKLWLLHGDGNTGFLNKDVWNTSDMVHWTKISDSIQIPERIAAMSAVFKNKMFIFGGQQLPGVWSGAQDTVFNDVYSSTDGITWKLETANAGWSPRGYIHGSCIDNADTLWLLGGSQYNSYGFTDIWNTGDGITWNKVLDCAPFQGAVFTNVEYFDNKMWVIAGNNGTSTDLVPDPDFLGDLNQVWYSSNGRDWFELKNSPWPHRHGSGTDVFNDSLYLTGGYENDFWKLIKQ
jgi:hypothetical protein